MFIYNKQKKMFKKIQKAKGEKYKMGHSKVIYVCVSFLYKFQP